MKKIVSIFLFSISLTAFAAPQEGVFCLAEGVGTPTASQFEILSAWSEVIDAISVATKTKYKGQHMQNFDAIERALKNNTCTIALIKPVHYAAMAMRDHQYQMVASVKGSFIGNFVVRGDDQRMKTINDLAGKTIMLPDPKALQSALAKRELRELKITPAPEIKHTRLQEVVLYSVEKGFADAGFVNPTIAKIWTDKGGKVLYQTKPNPYWVFLASKELSPKEVEVIREKLLRIEKTEKGASSLAKIGIKGIEIIDSKDYLRLLDGLS